MPDLQNYPLYVIFLLGFAVIVLSSELGLSLGRRADGGGISTLQGASLGLLGLMIGFTFAMALTRFEARRDAVLNEANSIGTAALRARLLPAPHNKEGLKLLQDYAQLHLDITRRAPSDAELNAAIGRSNAIQEQLWRHAMDVAARDNGMVPSGLFIQSLNEMIDNQGKRLAALRNRVPNSVVFTLYIIAAVASAFGGYARGAESHSRLPIYVMGLLVSVVILLVLDLDRPNLGFIEVSQRPMADTVMSIRSYTE